MGTFGRHLLPEWPLDPAISYLNHGTVGVTPLRVLAAQQAIRDAIERQPSRFLLRDLAPAGPGAPTPSRAGQAPHLRQAAARIAPFFGVREPDLVFVDNTTTGANAVLQSFPLQPGDEVLVSDACYGGVANAAQFAARRAGASVTTAVLPFPAVETRAIVAAYLDAVTAHTRIAIVDHVAAQSAIVMPAGEIVAALRARGVAVLVDGAHVPGAIALDIASIGADWYVGNLHKWMWTPRSSAILWAAPERQATLHPVVASWGLDRGFADAFDAPGTRDPSPHLTAPAAIDFMRELGVEAVMAYNHQMAVEAGRFLSDSWRTPLETPATMVPTMIAVRMPEALGHTADAANRVRDHLLFDDQIEVAVHAIRGQLWMRVSVQIYNDHADIEHLDQAVRALVRRASAHPAR